MTYAITSLTEQIKTRVTSVENGRTWQAKAAGDATMPNGAAIFATTGAWEDFSTPARDFRLLIAIDVVRGFPDRFARRSDRYAIPAGKSVADMRKELQSVLDSELATRKVSYTRSDGSEWTLSVKDVVDRAVDFEMAYNPNDCVERLCCRAEANYRAPDLAEADCRQYSHGGSKGRSLRLRAHGGKRCSVSTKRQRDV